MVPCILEDDMAKQNLKKLHEEVCTRAKWHCEVCGRYGDRQTLCSHHLLTRGARIDLEQDPDNGICVCAFCHHDIHSGLIKLDPKRYEKIKQKQL